MSKVQRPAAEPAAQDCARALKLLSALVGEYAGALSFLHGEEIIATEDVDWIKENAGELSLCAGNPDGTTCFVYGFDEEGDAESWKSYRLAPTAVLHQEGQGAIAFWALEAPLPVAEVQPLADALGMSFDEPVPLPGVLGWEAAHIDTNTFYALAELRDAYDPEEETPDETGHEPVDGQEEPAPWEEQRYGEAVIKTPGYWPESDPKLHQTMIISRGANAESKKWVPTELPIGGFIGTLCFHKEGPKDGAAFVCGEVVGDRRTANAMKALYAVGLDIDVGMSSAKIDELLAKLGALAVRYTTHSHMKTISEFRKDAVMKFAEDREVDDELVRDFLREVHKVEAKIADSAVFMGFEHEEGGIVARIEHDRWPKNRIALPLKEPFVIADEGRTQKDAIEKWKKVPAALAAHLGVPIDRTGVDPSRLFYYPRHRKGSPHEIALFGGELFDWRSLELDDPFATLANELDKGAKTSKSKTPEGRDLGRWSMKCAHGFQIVDLLREQCEDRIRGNASHGGVTVECPFDEMHSNAGEADDAACFAVNAGDGPSEWFTVKCQHDSCRGLTMLDMVGKMVKDGWFPRETLDDEHYNAAAPEEAPNPEAAVKIAAQDQARAEYQKRADALTPASTVDEIEAVAQFIAEARLSPVARDDALKAMAANTQRSARVIGQTLKLAERRAQGETAAPVQDGVAVQADGRRILQYRGEAPDHVEAYQFLVDTICAANREAPNFTSNLGALMHMKRHGGRVTFEPLTPTSLRAQLSQYCSFMSVGNEHIEPKRRPPHQDVCTDLFHSLEPGAVPEQPEIRRAPTIGADGTLLDSDGLHGGVYVDLGGLEVPPIPDNPTPDQIAAARGVVMNEVLGDFRFYDKGDPSGAASRANAAAMLITPFMRDLIDGPAPVFGVGKPQPGAGGSLLAKTSQILLDGKETAPTDYPDREEEMQKVLVAAIQAGQSHLFFDNVIRFNSPTILKSTTAEYVGGRLLGLSQMVERPNRFVWQFTGNNPALGGEMRRRTVPLNLNADAAENAERAFAHRNFERWLKENRGRVIAALLTLIRAWVVAKKPAGSAKPLKSFEGWTEALSGVLDYAGISGLLNNRPAERADREGAEVAGFADEWWRKFSAQAVTTTEVFEWATDIRSPLIGRGYDDAEKRRGFEDKLDGLNGRTFEIDGARRMLDRDEITGLWAMVKLPDRKSAEVAEAA